MRTTRTALPTLFLLVTLTLAACTSDSDATPTTEATPTLEASPTASATATPPPVAATPAASPTPAATVPPRQTISGIELGPAVQRVYPQCAGVDLEIGEWRDVVDTNLDLLPNYVPEGAALRSAPAITTCGGQPVSVGFGYALEGRGLLTIFAFIGEPRFKVAQHAERIVPVRLSENDQRPAAMIPPPPRGTLDDGVLLLIREPWGLITVQADGLTRTQLLATGIGVQHGSSRAPARDPVLTGIPEVDTIIEAALARDLDTLEGLIAYTKATCRTDEPGYGPTCDQLGLPAGTTYQGVSAGGCDVGLAPRQFVPDILGRDFGEALTLFGVYVPTAPSTGRNADYRVIFAPADLGQFAAIRGLSVSDGRIVRITGSCGSIFPAESDVDHWIVEPAAFSFDPLTVLGPLDDSASRSFGPVLPANSGAWLVEVATGAATLLAPDSSGDTILRSSFIGGLPTIEAADGAALWRATFDLAGHPIEVRDPASGCEPLEDGAIRVRVPGSEGPRTFEDVTCGPISPDGRLLTYGLPAESIELPNGFILPTWDQWLIDLTTDERTLLRASMRHCGGCDTGFSSTWSPSSRYVTLPELTSPGDVFLADSVSGTVRQINLVEAATYRPYQPWWAATRDRLVYPAGGGGTIFEDLETGRRLDLPHVAWPAAFDPSGRYLYSPAWWLSGTWDGGDTTVFEAVTGAVVATLPGRVVPGLLWGGTSIPVAAFGAAADGGVAAALEGAPDCEGTTLYSPTLDEPVCFPSTTSATFSPDGSQLALARSPGQFDLVIVDVETGEARLVAEDLHGRQPSGFTWNDTGTHIIVRWPDWLGL